MKSRNLGKIKLPQKPPIQGGLQNGGNTGF